MITPDIASKLMFKNIYPLHKTSKSLFTACGYALAEDVIADRDLPPFDNSAMDGFAVRYRDLTNCPCSLRMTGEVSAGSDSVVIVHSGACARILTGAAIPPGADSVSMVEDTEQSGETVTFNNPVKSGANVRRKGEMASKGTILLRRGTVLGPVQIGLCASAGKAELMVYSRPRVALISTGDELQAVHNPVGTHQIHDSNGPLLHAMLFAWGFPVSSHKILPDNPHGIAEEITRLAAHNEIIISTGGVSVGVHDYVPRSVEQIGGTVHFHTVAMKPGKPILYATLPDHRHVFGLPGNPLSVMTCFHEFVLPALRRLSGVHENQCRPALFLPLAASVASKEDRVHYVLSRILWHAEGPKVEPVKNHGSADLPAGTRADGVIVIPMNAGEIPAGSPVEFRPWRSLP